MVHTCLSILDLSSAVSQPMLSHNGRYVVSYNGEIYNYKELKADLSALNISFKSGSGLKRLIQSVGFDKTLDKNALTQFIPQKWLLKKVLTSLLIQMSILLQLKIFIYGSSS
jgi:hypothetical protein